MLKGHIYLLGAMLILASAAGAADSLFIKGDDYPGSSMNSITSGDYDNDGDIDIAIAEGYNHLGDEIAVYHNDGLGQLELQAYYVVGTAPRKLTSADLNGDDYLDLAVSLYPQGEIKILTNNGDGTFTVGAGISAGDWPYKICAGDLDGDSDLDLAVASRATSYISILFNDGAGSFSAPVTLIAGIDVMDVVMADFDLDSDSDLAVANYSSPGFSIFLNSGDGTFSSAIDYTSSWGPFILGPTDFDNDADIDLILFCPHNSPGAALALYHTNDGDGTFTPDPSPPQTLGGGYFEDAILCDFTNDGLDDISVVTSLPEVWGFNYVWSNAGDGLFELADWDTLHSLGRSAAAGDLDNDGDQDLVVGHILGFVTMFNRTVYPCGDANADGTANVGDVVYLVAYIFKGGPAPFPVGAGDANCDGNVNVADAVYLIAYIFNDGPAPCCP